ncbi:MAG: hypothetical protein GX389_04765 [Clostridiaceae bacterium]|jgi:hypothetical protein|nr:hypothetical protein [Clostridiaceae bacterium]
MQKAMFEKDILYPTENHLEPGSVHIKVCSPGNTGEIPVVIKGKTTHNPTDYLLEIVEILQTDVFDRIRINIKENGVLYFVTLDDKSVLKVKFTDKNKYVSEEVSNTDTKNIN